MQQMFIYSVKFMMKVTLMSRIFWVKIAYIFVCWKAENFIEDSTKCNFRNIFDAIARCDCFTRRLGNKKHRTRGYFEKKSPLVHGFWEPGAVFNESEAIQWMGKFGCVHFDTSLNEAGKTFFTSYLFFRFWSVPGPFVDLELNARIIHGWLNFFYAFWIH